MNELTITELEKRWESALAVTQAAVVRNPGAYRQLKSLAGHIVGKPLDISEYRPTAEKLSGLLKTMDPDGQGSIFYYFNDRISPSSIWHVSLLRMECKDLLDHLRAFDDWRKNRCHLKILK
jgi:hypothetical protein